MQASQRFKRRAIVLAAGSFAALAGVRAFDLGAQRAEILRSGDRRGANLALVLTGYLRQTFASVDASLRQLALHSRRVGGASASRDAWLPTLISARAALQGVGSISVVDTGGVIRHSTQPLIVGQVRSDYYVFQRHKGDTADALVADAPFKALSGVYLIPLGRRLTAANGRFAGVIVTTLVPDELRDVFRAVDVGRDGLVAVFHRDGAVVIREPSERNPIGETAQREPLFQAVMAAGDSGAGRVRAAGGPVLRTASRALPDRAIAVVVALGERELLSDWRHDANVSAVILVLLAVAIAAALVLLFRQMDTRAAAEEALTRSQRLESLGRLTGGVAHDFNNLLTVILGNIAILKDARAGAGGAGGAESTAQIERAAVRGSALVQQLLAFARRQPLHPRVVDLMALVTEAKPMLDRVLGEDMKLHVSYAPGRYVANVDPVRAESALLNLCINARDAMVEGGTIAIGLRKAEVSAEGEAASKPSAVPPGQYVVVSVADTGAGIAPEHLPHVFEPFFTTKEVGRGTGLGLASVYGFVTQSGGHVEIESRVGPGGGTTVRLFFPEVTDAEVTSLPAADAAPAAGAGRGQGQLVLLVEDQTDVGDVTEKFLSSLGYRVLRARDGRSALREAEAVGRIDLLLTDVVMPKGMSGPQLAQELSRRQQGLRVLYVSGDSARQLSEGAPLLAKPFTREALAAAVAAALRSGRP